MGHPDLESFRLKLDHYVQLLWKMGYREKVIEYFHLDTLAGYSLGEADLLRRAMGKKKPEEMAKQKERFMQGAEGLKISKTKAEKIFDLMAKFAEYGFNKSHSAAYALISYPRLHTLKPIIR